MSRPCLFVTGTDTGVGKTTISRALLRAWRRHGLGVVPLKPIETGCGPELRAEDAEALARAAGTDPAQACLSRWRQPLAPQAAAQEAGEVIDAAALLRQCQEVPGERLLLEGAGGLLVPIAPGFTMADLAAGLAAAVLIVARSRLGTLNHTLLTVAECRRRGLPVAGVVLNRVDERPGPEERTHAGLIAQHGEVAVLGTFPHVPGADDEDLADLALRHVALDGLWSVR